MEYCCHFWAEASSITFAGLDSNVYVVEGESTHQSIRVEIGQDTAFPNGQKEPGQTLQALIATSDGHALIIW